MVEQSVALSMAKLKASKAKEQKPDWKKDARVAIPCLLLVIGVIVLIGMLFSAMLKSAS